MKRKINKENLKPKPEILSFLNFTIIGMSFQKMFWYRYESHMGDDRSGQGRKETQISASKVDGASSG